MTSIFHLDIFPKISLSFDKFVFLIENIVPVRILPICVGRLAGQLLRRSSG